MALIELSFADHAKLKSQGRSFDCQTCPDRIKKLRRCLEDRFDFTGDDNAVFPIQIEKGLNLYGFCPAKATWDPEAVTAYRMLLIARETGNMIDNEPLSMQSSAWIELLSWFIGFYDNLKFVQRLKMVFGDAKG